MIKCPVCDHENLLDTLENCHICGWTLTLLNQSHQEPAQHLETLQKQEQIHLAWAKSTWRQLQQTEQSLLAHNSQSEELNLKSSTSELLSSLTENRISEDDIPSLQTEIVHFKQLLNQAALERAQIQSQLEWVLYRLEQLNLDSDHQEENHIALVSDLGIDYYPLAQLLADGQWQQADELTWTTLLKITQREIDGWLSLEDLKNFPETDFSTINNLWEYYSHGLFGLKAQHQIWESVAADYIDFSYQVGWRTEESWKYYDELSFSLEAPPGHLPVIAWRRRACYGVGHQMAGETQAALIAKHHNAITFNPSIPSL